MTDEPIPAATVLLLRDAPAFEVLMVKRHADIGFAGGAIVFPGGRIDPGDHEPRWATRASGLEPSIAPAQVAAIREAFEETGVLIAREGKRGAGAPLIDGDRAAALEPWRRAIEKDDSKFIAMMREENLALACDQLCLFAHWVAPPGLHRRFDTMFFAAQSPPGQRAVEDGGEATEVLWIAPADAIEARRRGERKIIFPTARNIELLGASDCAEAVFAAARGRKIEPVTPILEMREGVAWLTIPKDLGYPVTEEILDPTLRG
ncbi:MAG: hypothetical protein WD076_07220 [Parvularculaceae bacterium]